MRRIKFIAFSGGCFSGKTTTMLLLKEELERNGKSVVILGENIRDFIKDDLTIQDIRKDANTYFELQHKVIMSKIAFETRYMNAKYKVEKDIIVLADRSIIDSLFYLLFYVDKNQLTNKNICEYEKLYKLVDEWARNAYNGLYDMILMFEPLNLVCEDLTYRPNNINVLKYTESRMIKTLHNAYFGSTKYSKSNLAVVNIDLNNAKTGIVKYLYNLLNN